MKIGIPNMEVLTDRLTLLNSFQEPDVTTVQPFTGDLGNDGDYQSVVAPCYK